MRKSAPYCAVSEPTPTASLGRAWGSALAGAANSATSVLVPAAPTASATFALLNMHSLPGATHRGALLRGPDVREGGALRGQAMLNRERTDARLLVRLDQVGQQPRRGLGD